MSEAPAVQQDERVFRALADSTRRRLLDLLRRGPATTGNLAERFESSRFAIMKHLRVLEEAGLVLVRRKGRERWNHLNAVPVQQVWERWVSPLAAPRAASFLALARHVEQTEEPGMPIRTEETAAIAHVEVEIEIDAPREKVWDAFCDDMASWWRDDFKTDERSKGASLDVRLGGHLAEDYGDGDGLIWMSVVLLKKGERIDFVGHSSAEWGGPSAGYHSFTFHEEENRTVLRLSESYHGRVDAASATSLEDGWKMLLGEGLKPWVEKLD